KLSAAPGAEVRVQLPPRDDELLARLLAAAIESSDSPATRDALLRVSRAEGARVAEQLAADDDGALVRELDRRGYAPVVDGDEIRLRNCPCHHLVSDHRDLVGSLNFELLYAATVPGGSVRAVLEPRRDLCCVALRRVEA